MIGRLDSTSQESVIYGILNAGNQILSAALPPPLLSPHVGTPTYATVRVKCLDANIARHGECQHTILRFAVAKRKTTRLAELLDGFQSQM